MKDILFKGQETQTKEWREGDLIHGVGAKYGRMYILPLTHVYPKGCHSMDGWEVVPETVGQYIGVKGYEGDYEDRHKNEVKLFEGDIVEAMSEGVKGTFVIKFRNESQPTFMLYPAWQGGKMWSIAASDIGRTKGDYYDDLKRIGNIHDNPELLNP